MNNYTLEEIEEMRKFLDPNHFFVHLGSWAFLPLFTQHQPVEGVTREEALMYVLWMSLFNNYHVTSVMEAKHVQCKDDIKFLKELYSRLPTILRIPIVRRTSTEIIFGNGSRIMASCNPLHLRGRSLNHGLVSKEIEGKALEDIQYCLIPSISTFANSGLIYFS